MLLLKTSLIYYRLDKETRRWQKTSKTTAKFGGLCEERPKKGKGGKKSRANRPTAGSNGKIKKIDVLR